MWETEPTGTDYTCSRRASSRCVLRGLRGALREPAVPEESMKALQLSRDWTIQFKKYKHHSWMSSVYCVVYFAACAAPSESQQCPRIRACCRRTTCTFKLVLVIYIYIYMYIERERDIHKFMYIHIYIYIYMYITYIYIYVLMARPAPSQRAGKNRYCMCVFVFSCSF